MAGDPLTEHERWMHAALALGRRSMGLAAPNPSVAALLVKDGVLLGRGVTAPGGRPHAEPRAIAEAGEAARGATLYVTLEPCSHAGRTPPCVDAILDAGVACVVFALLDPDPRVAGRGLERLRDGGVRVVGPVAEGAARRDHLGHVLRVTQGRPSVTVKMAETADGFAARASGQERLLITGSTANRWVHMQRALHDAILIGSGTALADDPQLTVRLAGVNRKIMRIVLDSELRLPADSALLRATGSDPLVIVTSAAAPESRATSLTRSGATILRVPPDQDGLDLAATLAELGRMGITRLFCEGGPTLASRLVERELADTVLVLTGEAPIGSGQPAFGPAARAALAEPALFSLVRERLLAADRLRVFEKVESACSPDL